MLSIIYEDAELLVVNKPADLVCHPTKAGPMSSLISRVRLYLGPSSHPQLINRLDRETSGVVLVAKEAGAALELRRLWENGAVTKRYRAIVRGRVDSGSGRIDAPLGRDEKSPVAIKDCVRPDGAPAVTEFELLNAWSVRDDMPRAGAGDDLWDGREAKRSLPRHDLGSSEYYSLLSVRPLSGRKHQIRIHLAHVGHPIVGDKLYGGDETCYLNFVQSRLTEEQQAALLLPNQALHAESVSLFWRDADWSFRAEPEPWFTTFIPGFVCLNS